MVAKSNKSDSCAAEERLRRLQEAVRPFAEWLASCGIYYFRGENVMDRGPVIVTIEELEALVALAKED